MRWSKKLDVWGFGSYRLIGRRNNCKIEIVYDGRLRHYYFSIYHLKQGNRYFSTHDDLTYQTEQECIAGAIGYLERINYWRPVKRRASTIAKKEDEIKTLKQMAEYLANHPCEVISTKPDYTERND